MILDADQGFGQEPPRYDLCIVGAGAAGITVALELEATGRRVCLLEAGGPDYERETQRLFEGEVVGGRYPLLRSTRVGALGGTTTVWAGWCRPLEARDFESWPFGLDELSPYYARAHEICGLAAYDYDPEHWAGLLGSDRILSGDAAFRDEIFHIGVQDFGRRYRERLLRSKTIDLVLHAPVTRARMEGPGCTAVEIRTLGGQQLAIRADRFVLAAGGIENARLLLLSGDQRAGVPGNAGSLVGRYFADHAFVDPGTLVLHTSRSLGFYHGRPVASSPGASSVRGVLSLRREFLERERLLNAALFFHPRYEAHRVFATDEVKATLTLWNQLKGRAVPGPVWPYLRRAVRGPHQVTVALARKLAVGPGPARRWRMRAEFETGFRADNRVTLGDERDRLGRRQVRLEWQLGDGDIENLRRVIARFDQAVREAGVGQLERGFPDTAEGWHQAVEPAMHHMGTTRMHVDPRQGVVDANSRVHRTSNLYVTGSSVFPSGGYANPTLTIVALAARLGDHLQRRT